MQIVIDIPEEDYIRLRDEGMFGNVTTFKRAVREGTPLPKCHGRLIDAGELEECKEIMNTISGESKYAVRMDDIRNMSTIIEADGGDSE